MSVHALAAHAQTSSSQNSPKVQCEAPKMTASS